MPVVVRTRRVRSWKGEEGRHQLGDTGHRARAGAAIRRVSSLWHRLSASLWFIPGVILGSCVALAVILLQIDAFVGQKPLEHWPFLFGAGASGARSMLTAIAGSMVTVAGVIFSVTLVALSLASSQYSPRVLRNFMDDRANQSVLGVFVGVFAYCLIVLRAVRGEDNGEFVPSIAVLGGFILAFVAIAYLVYFIHHIAAAIQASSIMARIAQETIRNVDRLFPEELGTGGLPAPNDPSFAGPGGWAAIPAPRTGYITGVDGDSLLRLAAGRNAIIRMERGIGEFIIDRTPLASIRPAGADDDDLRRRLCSAFDIDHQRTPDQDPAFGVRQLVDIAVKALSPGINDPTTAEMVIDHLTAILLRLASRRMESPYRHDDGPGSDLRVIARVATFASLVHLSFDQIRRAGAGHPEILDRIAASLATLERATTDPERREVLRDHASALRQTAAACPSPADRDRAFRDRVEALIGSLH